MAVWSRMWQPLQAQLADQARSVVAAEQRVDSLENWRSTASEDLVALEKRARDLSARVDQLGPARLAVWSLAEADYLVRSAQRAAAFDYDPARAALALNLASATLAPVPGSAGARMALDKARSALEQVRVPDVGVLSSELAQAARALQVSPLREPGTAPVAAAAPGWRGAVQQAWQQLGEIIVVQRVGTPVQPLLRPHEIQYLRQQLALKLTAADFALQRRDSSAFQRELADVQLWADAYLSASEPATTTALGTVTRLSSVDLRPPLPDLSTLGAQLDALRRATGADRGP